ncbi:hypothetical protein [Candidatus Methanocrinis natronophilus]|uniref:Uncharacterized protein n=1 Tax=Candidatus Methanocrinis natronophilus TaxID=3033396 RepID=A0ABT5X689_9EURY|nr:hypothetical protein [Candidatus Methanocrinis natronophilus]MDF0590200.1 hypothetical protein [Candidatus Methanocrinis natronophilus]
MMKEMSIHEDPVGPSHRPMKTLSVWRGFATGPAGSLSKADRPVRIEIEGLRLLTPDQIRDLLLKRRGLGEVRMLMQEEASPTFVYLGRMTLGGETFRLVDVEHRSYGSEKVLIAMIAEDREGVARVGRSEVEGDFVGQIEIIVSVSENVSGRASERASERVSDAPGTMVIYRGALAGRYILHLDPQQRADRFEAY